MEKEKLFLLRRKKQIKLREIAEFIDCSIAMLSLFENDKANLDINKQILYKQFIENY
ncbi:XRE family transcriptional regulator [Planomicrobium sp. YIM 101495]|uniref:XRE family transcriptional regulator n=1 Tax=Planomicrobium sp. YIM 101495 TaxID=2665160 RepID=UPI0012B8B6CF|nr:XRE family transcriptional regulator [Planomicrobium sp. YIM 101495]MTD30121.1 XRE family transcriptional regulator [Planomicrobium sp. YIM 101495]